MFKSFATALFAAAASAAVTPGTTNGQSYYVEHNPSAITDALLHNETPVQYAAELEWFTNVIQTGDFGIGVIHGNIPISENFEGFQDKFNAWMINN